ncbi:MAG TPA: DoxX family protein [Actinopolymorphaceae bacterium]
MMIVRLLARPMLAAAFVVQGAKAVMDPEPLAPKAKDFAQRVLPKVRRALPEDVGERIPEDPRTLVRVNGAVQVLAGLALATGRAPRLGATILAASLVPTTLAGHPFWDIDDPEHRGSQRIQFLKNLGLTGGLLLAAVDTEGKPGLWWRTRYGARHARESSTRAARGVARDAARQTRREARSMSRTARSRWHALTARFGSR